MKKASTPRLLALALIVSAYACSSSTTTSTPTGIVAATADVTTIKNDGTKANVTATTKDAKGAAGTVISTGTPPLRPLQLAVTTTAPATQCASMATLQA